MTDGGKNEKAAALAAEIMRLAQNSILLNLRFMDPAVMRLAFTPSETTYRVDGNSIFYGDRFVLDRYLADRNQVTRDVLHMIMHCIFRHAFVGGVDPVLWDLACDTAAEHTVSSLGLDFLQTPYAEAQRDALKKLEAEAGALTAEKLYRYFREKNIPLEEASKLHTLFSCDDHSAWYNDGAPQEEDEKTGGEKSEDGGAPPPGAGSSEQEGESGEDGTDGGESGGNIDQQPPQTSPKSDIEKEWEEISRSVQMDMETFSKEKGDAAGGLTKQLQEANRDRYDYSAFLRKFAVSGETMKINDDEFDYVFYTYGLRLFGNMPLVEPLEYKEDNRVREFVVAIDTSGSTSGELVRKFLIKTYSILKSTESFFNHINLHIIQCDCDIQEHVKITTREELDSYINGFTVKGLGGTDFRPVFREVDRLVAEKEFTHLKGIIYFTDGYGTFPEKKPAYETAFVFVRNTFDSPAVPTWAIKVVLEDFDSI